MRSKDQVDTVVWLLHMTSN